MSGIIGTHNQFILSTADGGGLRRSGPRTKPHSGELTYSAPATTIQAPVMPEASGRTTEAVIDVDVTAANAAGQLAVSAVTVRPPLEAVVHDGEPTAFDPSVQSALAAQS